MIASVALLISGAIAFVYALRLLRPRPSVSLILYASLFFLYVIPMVIYLYVTGPNTFIYEEALSLSDSESIISRMQWSLVVMFFMLIVGSVCAKWFIPRSWHIEARSVAHLPSAGCELKSVYYASRLMRNMLWTCICLMAIVIATESQPSKIIYYYLMGDSEFEKIAMRHEGGGTPYYLYNVFLSAVAPFLVMILWCLHRRRSSDMEVRILFYLFFGLVLVGKLGLLSKAPAVMFVLQLAFFYFLISGGGASWKSIMILLMLGGSLLIATVMLVIPGSNYWDSLEFLRYRIFDIQNEVLLEYFAAFPDRIPHGWEYGLLGSYSRMPNEVVAQNYYLVSELTRGSRESTSTAMFIGDAWADFAWPGVIVTSFFSGFIPRCIDYYSLRNKFTDEWACIIAGCSFGVFTMLCTAMSTAMITGGLFLIPLASLLFLPRRGSFTHRSFEKIPLQSSK